MMTPQKPRIPRGCLECRRALKGTLNEDLRKQAVGKKSIILLRPTHAPPPAPTVRSVRTTERIAERRQERKRERYNSSKEEASELSSNWDS
ncbi:hypothetical protein ALC62_15125 [Cyphomyrmex costatus]|uniref:Uncharacterized protein n=1 Tax=Cyphomyrmex costatus TaxID=456900 RepID=A0A151I802_9HYME|nr:hypothetical protein ALC62_15125 [Cyphomyrmex costatus]